MTAIRVAHSGAEYEVLIGDLADSLPRLQSIADGRLLPIVSDRRVFDLYGKQFAGIAFAGPILVPEGEAAKDWGTLATVIEELSLLDVKRGTPIIALGGGSVGDVAGLAASLFKRGCPIVQVPTTLLAQADSAIGGKTAIDAAGQKNLAGTFHHPLMVIADPSLLDTLDDRQMRSGYAEVVKYGLIDDPDFFTWCEDHGAGIVDGNRYGRLAAIEHCVRAKARLVASDPEDTNGQRALLNLGHSFGHVIEALAGNSVLHGEAVAVGMCLAFRFSEFLGLTQGDDYLRVRDHLASIGLPTDLAELGLAGRGRELLAMMAHDKKAAATGPALVLVRGVGQAFLQRDIDRAVLAEFISGVA